VGNPRPIPASCPDSTADPLDERSLEALADRRRFTPENLRHLLDLKDRLMFGQALALAEWRERGDRTPAMFAEIKRLDLKVLELADALGILQGRLAFLPPAERVRFRPEGRFQVVLHARTFGLTMRDAARRFLVDEKTVASWVREATKNPDAKTVGSLLKAVPPVRAVADVVREAVALLDRMKVGGSKKIAEFLARSGIRIGRETVRKIRKNPPPMKEAEGEKGSRRERTGGQAIETGGATASGKEALSPKLQRSIRARYPNHVWMTDITSVPTLFGLWSLKVVAFLDVYSRFPLAFQVLRKEPTTDEILAALEKAIARFGVPKHFITDQGPQFTSGDFRDALRDRSIKQRFGAIGKTGSIAVIERVWRTMKETLGLGIVFQPLGVSHLT
jgi:putative transposase